MSIFHFNDQADNMQCLVNPKEKCIGEKCMAWMYRQQEEDGKRSTDIAKGVCGWVYAMAYFRDKNQHSNL